MRPSRTDILPVLAIIGGGAVGVLTSASVVLSSRSARHLRRTVLFGVALSGCGAEPTPELSWQRTENIHPADPTFSNPEEDPKRQAGDVIELGPGLNFKLPFVEGPRFGVEMAWPVYQHLDGPQLERDWRLTAGWKWAF